MGGSMWIKGVSMSLEYPLSDSADVRSADAPQIFLPADMNGWKQQLIKSLQSDGSISIAISSTSGPGVIAFAIGGHNEVGFGNADDQLQAGKVFGFNIHIDELAELGALIETAKAGGK